MKKKLLLTALGLLALLLGAAIVIPMVVDVDQHRPEIEAAISEATGREVKLGELRLRILPVPAISSAGVTVSEDPRFGSDLFLEADSLSISVNLLPLLRGKVGVDSIRIASPKLVVRRDGRSRWNLASLAGPPAETGPGGGRQIDTARGAMAGPGGTEASEPAAEGAVDLSVDSLELSGGEVTFIDGAVTPGKTVESRATKINLTLEDLSMTSAVGVDLSFDLENAGKVKLAGEIGPLPGAGGEAGLPMDARLRLDSFRAAAAAGYLKAFTGLVVHDGILDLDLRVKGTSPQKLAVSGSADLDGLKMDPLAGGGPPAVISGAVEIDGELGENESRFKKLVVRTGGSEVRLSGSVRDLNARPVLDVKVGTDRVALEDVRSVLRLLGPVLPRGLGGEGEIKIEASVKGRVSDPASMTLDGTAAVSGLEYSDPSLIEPIRGIGGQLKMSGGRLDIESFAASLGKSSVRGSCAITRFDRPVIDVSLRSPLIDLDNLLTLMATGKMALARPDEGAAGEIRRASLEGGLRDASDAAWIHAAAKASAPSMLPSVTIRGGLGVDRVRIMNLTLTSAQGKFGMEQGVATLNDVSLDMYGGKFSGSLETDLGKAGPPFRMTSTLSGVDFNAMAGDLSPDLENLIHGTLDAGLNLSGRGLGSAELDRNLKGSGNLALRDGKITSFGVLKLLAQGLEAAGGKVLGTEETPFKSLTGTFDIAAGRMRTSDLRLASPEMVMKGEGDVNLDMTLDLDLAARISPQVSSQMVSQTPDLRHLMDKRSRLALDLRLVGDLADPSVRIHPDTFKRIARSAAKERVTEEGQKLLDKLLGSGDDDD